MKQNIIEDTQKLAEIKERANGFSNALCGYISSLHDCGVYDGHIPNVGIYFGNKLIETYKYFRKNRVSFADSDVETAIEYYLTFAFLTPARNLITSYMKHNLTYEAKIRRFFGERVHARDMMLYKDYCNELFRFDIEKDVERALDFHLSSYKESEEYANDMDEIVERVNEELKELGIDRTYHFPVQKKKNMA